MTERKFAAFVDDLMDRSRLQGLPGAVTFVRRLDAVPPDTDVVIVDLARHGAVVAELRARLPNARIAAFGSHVDTDALDAARAAGADVVVPRSVFFRDPIAALGGAM